MLDYLKKLENSLNKIHQRFPTSEKGQSLVLVTLFLFFGFLAFAALATDGTILYLRRRQLQSMADGAALAAAIELSQLNSDAVAYQKAMDVIDTNEGEIDWYSNSATPNPPSTNVGTGTGLTMGIEIIDSCEVRVALTWSDVGTYFAQFVGRETLQVGANAHASCNRSGGLMPIAIKRFGDEEDTRTTPGGGPGSLDPYCDECDTTVSLPAQGHGDAFDFLLQEGSDEITDWPGWTAGVPIDPDQKFQSPSPHANPSNPGREFFIIGEGAEPNVSTAGLAFSGPVNLDLRHLTSGGVSYNGVPVDANSNTLKDYVETYIRRGYCCDIPEPGDQVGVIAGVSNAFTVDPFHETYDVGDIVAVIVYDGHAYKDPNLEITGSPEISTTHPTTTTIDSNALVYTIELDGDSAFKSASSGINLTVEGLDGFADWAFSNDSPQVGWPGNPDPRIVTLYVTPTLTTTTVGTTTVTNVVTGTRMFYVSAIDDGLGGTNIWRYWPGVASIGDEVGGVERDLPAISAAPDVPYINVAKGSPATTIKIDLTLWGVTADQDVTVSPPATLPQGIGWGNPQPSPDWTVNNVRWDPPSPPADQLTIKLEVDDTAIHDPTPEDPTPYVIPLTVSSAGMDSQTFNLYVLVREDDTTSTDYVVILGYAAIEVMEYLPNATNPNSVRARVISELWDDPSELTYGLRPRLIPWNQ